MRSLAIGLGLLVGFYAIGLGPALVLQRWTALPLRFVGPLAVLATAIASYAVFWIAFVVPPVRLPLVACTLLASAALFAGSWRTRGVFRELRAFDAWGPAVVAGALAAVYVLPLLAGPPRVNDRFAWKLPSDNILPAILADRVVLKTSTERPVPPLWPNGDRASERPPLQAAVAVTVGALVQANGGDEYQILATLCQAQWLPAVWLLAVACGLPRRATAVVLVACATSGYFFVNTIYTWPKLFAASFMLTALAVALEPGAEVAPARRARVVTVAALLASSLLAHPGTAFSAIGVALCWPLFRRVVRLDVDRHSALAACAVIAVLWAPWVAYQTFVDPPVGRLARQHLGDGRTDGTVLEAIARANLERPLAHHVRVRLANLASQIGRPTAAIWPDSIAEAQNQQFFRHGASLGLLLIGLAVVLGRRPADSDDDAAVVRALAWIAMAALTAWSLLVFGRDEALVHHGSPATTALLFFAGAYGLTRMPVAVTAALLAGHALAWLLIWYVPVWQGPWLGR